MTSKVKNIEQYIRGYVLSIIEQYFAKTPVTTDFLINFMEFHESNKHIDDMGYVVQCVMVQKMLTRLSKQKILRSIRIKSTTFYELRNQ